MTAYGRKRTLISVVFGVPERPLSGKAVIGPSLALRDFVLLHWSGFSFSILYNVAMKSQIVQVHGKCTAHLDLRKPMLPV